MVTVQKSLLIEHSSRQMFDLVDDVESYPMFLPWCSQTQVAFRDEKKTVATLHINYHSVKSHFTTENEKDCPSRMKIKLVDGPFRHLEAAWHFKALAENACKIEFQISYEFSNKLFEKIIGSIFSQIANTFVEAFVNRADVVYGASSV